MALLDNLLGGGGDSESSTDLGAILGTSPQLGLHASDILHSEQSDDGDSSSFTGVGDIGLGIAAPTVVGVNASSDQSSMGGDDNGGGLLGGLL